MMFVLVHKTTNKRKYFETSLQVEAHLLGKPVADYRVEVYSCVGEVTNIPAVVSELSDRLLEVK